MTIAYVNSDKFGFNDGNAGHVCNLGSSPSVGDFDFLCVNSDTTVSTPSGFTSTKSEVNNQGAYIFTRKAAGGEGSTVTVTTNGNNNAQVIWIRLSSGNAIDVAVSVKADNDPQASSPALSTGTLSATGEAIVAFMAGHRLNTTGNQSPTWGGSYTAAQTSNFGTGNSGVTGMVAYKIGVGTSAESPSVTWTGDTIFNRYMLAVTLTDAGGAAASNITGGGSEPLPTSTGTLTAGSDPDGPSDVTGGGSEPLPTGSGSLNSGVESGGADVWLKALATAAGLASTTPPLKVYGWNPDDVVAPCVYVAEYEIDYDRAMAGGLTVYTVTLRVLTSRSDERSGQGLLARILQPTGSSSVKAAIESARNHATGALGGLVQDLHVEGARALRFYQHAEASYVGAEFTVKVFA